MEIINSVIELRQRLGRESAIGLVPTMGNLHAGHIDLVRIARERLGPPGCLVMSIFVNRLQFGPGEDFDRYPRTFSEDIAKAEAAGVNILFAPGEADIYPQAQEYMVEPSALQDILDGAVRPGHFRGVATVVLKLFNMVQPRLAVFGKKDYQQCCVIANMVSQFNLPIDIVLADTVRAADGLALSSRNGYLTTTERAEAPRLYRQLRTIGQALLAGERNFPALEIAASDLLRAAGWQADYLTIRRQHDLLLPTANDGALVVLAAARLGATRLIDNLEVRVDRL